MARKPSKPTRTGAKRRILYSDYRRLSPEENKKLGFTAKARHYVLKSVKRIGKRTDSISARSHETLRTKQEYGLASPEVAKEARRAGALQYTSAKAQETATKNTDTATNKRLKRVIDSDEEIPYNIKQPKGQAFKLDKSDEPRYNANVTKKVNGERIPGQDEWLWTVRIADKIGDPRAKLIRSSPGSYSMRRVL